MSRLIQATIWHRDAPSMQRVQQRFRPLFRVALPVFDLVLIGFSVWGIIIGSRAVAEFTLWWFPPLLSAATGAAAFVALIGLVFQQSNVELSAKFSLAVCLAAYVVFLIASAMVDSAAAVLSAALAVAIIIILGWRVWDLIDQAAQEDDAGQSEEATGE